MFPVESRGPEFESTRHGDVKFSFYFLNLRAVEHAIRVKRVNSVSGPLSERRLTSD